MDRVHKHFVQGKRIAPILIDMGITKRCNIHCEFCYGYFQNMNGSMIPTDALLRLFKDAHKAGVKAIAIVGDGEPTMHPAFVDAVEVGKANGLDIAVATNGVLLPENKLRRLLRCCTWLRFNLSAIEEGYPIVHGADKWEQVKANIHMASKIARDENLPVTLGLQMVLTPHAFEYVQREAAFAIATGVDYFVIKQFSDPESSAMVGGEKEWYDKPEVQKILHDVEGWSTDRTKIVVKFKAIENRKRRPYDHCLDVPLLFQISGDGKCYPCGFLFGDERYCYGDITKQSIGEILNSEHYWNVVRTLQTTFDVHKDCRGCCRHDATNKFINDFVNKPEHLNFI